MRGLEKTLQVSVGTIRVRPLLQKDFYLTRYRTHGIGVDSRFEFSVEASLSVERTTSRLGVLFFRPAFPVKTYEGVN